MLGPATCHNPPAGMVQAEVSHHLDGGHRYMSQSRWAETRKNNQINLVKSQGICYNSVSHLGTASRAKEPRYLPLLYITIPLVAWAHIEKSNHLGARQRYVSESHL